MIVSRITFRTSVSAVALAMALGIGMPNKAYAAQCGFGDELDITAVGANQATACGPDAVAIGNRAIAEGADTVAVGTEANSDRC